MWFSICCEPPVVKSLLTPQNDRKNWFASLLRYVYPSGNWKCLQNTFFCFWGPYKYKIVWFSICLERIKMVDHSKWPQEWIYNGRSEICTPLRREPKVPPKCHFLFFQVIYNKISKVSISQELYVINRLTFQNYRKTHLSISV